MTTDYSHWPPAVARVCKLVEWIPTLLKQEGLAIKYSDTLERVEAALAALRAARPDGAGEALEVQCDPPYKVEKDERYNTFAIWAKDGQFDVLVADGVPTEERAQLIVSALRAALTAPGWRDIESAPKDGTPFLGYSIKWDAYGVCQWCEKVGAWDWCGGMVEERSPEYDEYHGPTQWMPLPTPPAQEQEP